MLITRILIVSTLALLANTQTITRATAIPTLTPSATLPNFTPSSTTFKTAPILTYLASVTTQPEWTSALRALASAIPASVLTEPGMEKLGDELPFHLLLAGLPSWASAMPSSYISYFYSIGAAERRLVWPAPSSVYARALFDDSQPAILRSYLASLTAQPEFTSANLALLSAMPTSVIPQLEADPLNYLDSILGNAGEVPSWVSAMPTRYVSYFSSIGAAERSLISVLEGPAATHGPQVKVIGAALAMGAAGLALI